MMKPVPVRDAVIDKAIRGDLRAFQEIVEGTQSFIFAVAFRLLGNRSDAQDVAQETFIRLWKHLGRYRKDVKLTTWLYKIVTNLCLDQLKSKHHNRYAGSMDDFLHVAGPDQTDHDVHQRELMKIILESADMLTPKQKAVFILRDIEGLSVEEVSAVMDAPAGQIKSNLYYARLRMSENLKEYREQFSRKGP